MLIFYKQQSYFSQIVSKKAQKAILFFMRNSKNNNIILDLYFSFTYLVSVYPINRTKNYRYIVRQRHGRFLCLDFIQMWNRKFQF